MNEEVRKWNCKIESNGFGNNYSQKMMVNGNVSKGESRINGIIKFHERKAYFKEIVTSKAQRTVIQQTPVKLDTSKQTIQKSEATKQTLQKTEVKQVIQKPEVSKQATNIPEVAIHATHKPEVAKKVIPKQKLEKEQASVDSDESEENEVNCDSNGLNSNSDGLQICHYKLRCMALDQNKMNHSRVHVDESEPKGHEEAPFESRDVKIRNSCWITDEYDVMDNLLGRGKFGEVRQCKERKTGRQLAAKFIEVQGPTERLDVQNEVDMMKCLQHPRLLQLYDVFVKRNNFCLVLELILGGELFERVINDDFILTEKACIMFMRQICEGIEFMHNNSILHLDLKPENILCLTREGNRIKIIDFGLARKYNPEHELRILFGTPEFMAPEQANFEPIFPSTDMWSVGIICYILLSGLSPFLGDNENETIANITEAKWDFKAEEFDSVSGEAKDFISKLIHKDETKRMTASECVAHKWLRRSEKRERIPTRSLSTKRLKKFVYRRKWQKAVNAMLALKRMGVKL